jgi:hypothetical protein
METGNDEEKLNCFNCILKLSKELKIEFNLAKIRIKVGGQK